MLITYEYTCLIVWYMMMGANIFLISFQGEPGEGYEGSWNRCRRTCDLQSNASFPHDRLEGARRGAREGAREGERNENLNRHRRTGDARR